MLRENTMKRLRVTWWRADKWIAHIEALKAREVPIRGPELGDAVMAADGRNAGVMHGGAGDFASDGKRLEFVKIAAAFPDENKRGRSHPSADGLAGGLQRGGWPVNARMGDDGEKLVDTRPRNGPGIVAASEFEESCSRLPMPLRVLAVRINQQVRIKGDHE